MALGGALQEQATLSGGLVRSATSLRELSGGAEQGNDAVRDATALVQQMLALAHDGTEASATLFTRMERYRDQVGRLLEEEQSVERILAPLRIIQTLFRIESASLPTDVQAAFAALSGEIPQFEAHVRDAFAQHADELGATRRNIEVTIARLREQEAIRAAEIATRRESIGDTLAALEREVADIRERDGRLHALLAQIDQRAGAVVVSLQYQDITRQKMEHVRQALREMVERAKSASGSRQPLDYQFVFNASRLEAGQAEAIREELQHAVATIASGARDILDGLQRIEADSWSRAELIGAAEAEKARVARLASTLRDAGLLLTEASNGANEAIALVRSFGGVATSVATTAREMAEGMRMIALNAQVQAAQAGEQGAGLLILAERTYLISEEIKRVTRSIGDEFAEAARQLGGIVSTGESLMAQTDQQRSELGAASQRAANGLDQHREQAVALFKEISESLEAIEQRSAAMSREAEFDDAFCAPLERLHVELRAIAAEMEPLASARSGATESPASLEVMQERYTMESERKVHAAALGGTSTAPSAAAVPVDNVELF